MAAEARVQPGSGRTRDEPAGGPARFVARVEARPLAVRMLLYALLKRFEKHIGPSDAGSVELVLAEILNNIVEHAYGEESIGEVEVVADMLPETLVCNVQDWGRSLPGLAIPEGALPSCGAGIETLPEGGWGWALIRTVASDLDYRRDAGCNRLRVAIPISFE